MKKLVVFLLMVNVAHAEQVGDMNADGQVGLEEAIIALQVAAGAVPAASLGTYIPATGNAITSDVLSGKTFSTTVGDGLTGSMVDQGDVTLIPGTSPKPIEQGYHNGQGYCAGDADLVPANIYEGITIFGVTGDRPSRYHDIGNGYIRDNFTSLIWTVKELNVFISYNEAVNICNDLIYNSYTDWSLPSYSELLGIVSCTTGPPMYSIGLEGCNPDSIIPTVDAGEMVNLVLYNEHPVEAEDDMTVYFNTINFNNGKTDIGYKGVSTFRRFLCVHPNIYFSFIMP